MKKLAVAPTKTTTKKSSREILDRDRLAVIRGGADARSYVTGYFQLDLDGVQ